MKRLVNCLFLGAWPLLAAPPQPIQQVPLDDRVVVTVPVATNRVTTLSFPGPIAAIDGAGISVDPKVPGLFQLAHAKGSAFLSVRALSRRASSNLNIRWNKRTYVFELVESDTPILALHLESGSRPASAASGPVVSPQRLLALLDKARAFPLLRQQHPEAVADVDVRTFGEKPQITDFEAFEVRIEEIFRFNAEDTLVFHLTLRNKSDHDIPIVPGSMSVRVGTRLFHPSITDAPALLPARSTTTTYLAITGSPDGWRNDLSVRNEFSILMRRDVSPAQATPAQP